jgi:hypothetical protein
MLKNPWGNFKFVKKLPQYQSNEQKTHFTLPLYDTGTTKTYGVVFNMVRTRRD